jgi:hypothetical protein
MGPSVDGAGGVPPAPTGESRRSWAGSPPRPSNSLYLFDAGKVSASPRGFPLHSRKRGAPDSSTLTGSPTRRIPPPSTTPFCPKKTLPFPPAVLRQRPEGFGAVQATGGGVNGGDGAAGTGLHQADGHVSDPDLPPPVLGVGSRGSGHHQVRAEPGHGERPGKPSIQLRQPRIRGHQEGIAVGEGHPVSRGMVRIHRAEGLLRDEHRSTGMSQHLREPGVGVRIRRQGFHPIPPDLHLQDGAASGNQGEEQGGWRRGLRRGERHPQPARLPAGLPGSGLRGVEPRRIRRHRSGPRWVGHQGGMEEGHGRDATLGEETPRGIHQHPSPVPVEAQGPDGPSGNGDSARPLDGIQMQGGDMHGSGSPRWSRKGCAAQAFAGPPGAKTMGTPSGPMVPPVLPKGPPPPAPRSPGPSRKRGTTVGSPPSSRISKR